MVLGSDALFVDPESNDAKRIISHGVALTGSLRTTGMAGIVRPAALTSDTIAANLDRYGFGMHIPYAPGPRERVRPEYAIAAAQFTSEPRWYLSAMAVLLCRPDIDWDLMTYLARTYGFAGMMLGALTELAESGWEFRSPLSMLAGYEPIGIDIDLSEVLRVYAAEMESWTRAA